MYVRGHVVVGLLGPMYAHDALVVRRYEMQAIASRTKSGNCIWNCQIPIHKGWSGIIGLSHFCVVVTDKIINFSVYLCSTLGVLVSHRLSSELPR
jgi:hypothetical protein